MSMPEAAQPTRVVKSSVHQPMPRSKERSASRGRVDPFYPQPLQRPWWMLAGPVLKACFGVAIAPLRLLVMIAELVMAAVVLGIAGAIGAWWLGWITDAQVLDIARPLGERLMAMVQSLGYM